MKDVRFIAKSAIVAGLYVALTWILAPISFGAIQFRLSEVLVLLVLLNPKFSFALVIGCFVANIASPMGFYDIIFGTLATLIAVVIMTKIKNIWLGAFVPVISNGIIIAVELGFAYSMFAPIAFWYNVLTIALGELIVLYGIGVPAMLIIKRNDKMKELLEIKE